MDPSERLIAPAGLGGEGADPSAFEGAGRKLAAVFLIVTGVKLLLAWLVPFTGDEMFLALQAEHLRLGYYDHPPAVMWILYGLSSLGRSPPWLRLPTIITTDTVAIILYLLLRPYDRQRAYLASVLFLVCPLDTAFFVISTETPLMLASFGSVSLLFLAERQGRYRYYALSGMCLGLAFLSKYFAVLLGLSYLVFFVSMPGSRRRWQGFTLLILASLPAVTINVAWNYLTGWPNIMHNWINRLPPETHSLLNLLSLAAVLVYFLTVPMILFFYRNRRALLHRFRRSEFRVVGLAFVVPLLVFSVVSLRKTIGIHWLLSFLPLVYILVAAAFSSVEIAKCVKFAIVISAFQVALVLGVSVAARFGPVDRLRDFLSPSDMATLVLHIRPQGVLDEIDRELRVEGSDCVLATKSYQLSALLQYYTGHRSVVLGRGSNHAREDDILTDFRTLDGREFLILYKSEPDENEYLPFFGRCVTRRIETEGAHFTLVRGYGFRYSVYRERVLRHILERYYRIPVWLPGSRNFFRERYGFEPLQPRP